MVWHWLCRSPQISAPAVHDSGSVSETSCGSSPAKSLNGQVMQFHSQLLRWHLSGRKQKDLAANAFHVSAQSIGPSRFSFSRIVKWSTSTPHLLTHWAAPKWSPKQGHPACPALRQRPRWSKWDPKRKSDEKVPLGMWPSQKELSKKRRSHFDLKTWSQCSMVTNAWKQQNQMCHSVCELHPMLNYVTGFVRGCNVRECKEGHLKLEVFSACDQAATRPSGLANSVHSNFKVTTSRERDQWTHSHSNSLDTR